MNLIGKKICIRAVEYDDLLFLRKLMNDPAIENQTIDFHFPISEKGQVAWYENFDEQGELRCIIENREKEIPIGYLSLTNIDYRNQCAAAGIKMDTFSEARVNGDMDEIFSLMKSFCFDELNIQRIEAEVLSDNLFSISNLKKHGFVQEGLLRKKCYRNGKWKDVVIFSLLKDEKSGGGYNEQTDY